MNDDDALDEPLRQALQEAADSVEPDAGGLDQIWAKARARRDRRPVRYGLAAAVQHAGLGWPSWPGPRAWPTAASRWIAQGLWPDAGQPGRLGWLRPAAALATALLVATGTAWAVTTLPQVLTSTAGNSQNYVPGGSGGPQSPAVSSPTPGVSQAGQGPGSQAGASGTPSPSPTCSSGNVNLYSPSPSLSPSPSTTPSPSPTPSSTGTGSSSATASPSPGPTSPSPSAATTPTPTPTPTVTATPPASASPGPCG